MVQIKDADRKNCREREHKMEANSEDAHAQKNSHRVLQPETGPAAQLVQPVCLLNLSACGPYPT